MRVRLLVSEALRSIGANISTTMAATMTVLIGMFLLGLFIALFSWVNSWTDHVRQDVLVKVFFVQEITQVPRAMKRPSRNMPIRTVMTAATDVERFAASERNASETKSRGLTSRSRRGARRERRCRPRAR